MKNIFFASMIVLLSACNTPISAATSVERCQKDARQGFTERYYWRCDRNEETQTLIAQTDLQALGLANREDFEKYLAKLHQNHASMKKYRDENFPRNSPYEQSPNSPAFHRYIKELKGYEIRINAFTALFEYAFRQSF